MNEDYLFGKYRILRILANGSGGEVFLAEHKALDERRVIKCLYRNRPFFEERRKEAHILKQLHHAAIPRIYDIEEDEQAIYIIEEAMDGETLNEILFRQKTLSVSFILFYSIQLCEIIEYLHKEGILYLDIKPENIMICGDRLSLVDFGGAVRAKEASAVSFGTQGFAAPEQYRGEVQERTDVYGIGRVLGIMLGQASERESKQRKELRKVYERCVQTLPAGRFRSVADLREKLQELYCRKADRSKERKAGELRTIGVIGVHEGAETAAVCVAAAGYISEHENGRVACVDLSGQGMFRALYESLHGNVRSVPKEFTIRDVCYRTDLWEQGIEGIFAQGFSAVVIHFGGKETIPLSEFFRCSQRIVVGDVFPWRMADWYRMEGRLKDALSEMDITALITGGDCGEVPLRFHRILELPRFSDILHPDGATGRFLKKLLRH